MAERGKDKAIYLEEVLCQAANRGGSRIGRNEFPLYRGNQKVLSLLKWAIIVAGNRQK
jgi:hypothetical protein